MLSNTWFMVNEDQPEHRLRAGAIGIHCGFHLENNLWVVFPIRSRAKAFRGFWLDRGDLYEVQAPDDWFAEPVLYKEGAIE